MRFLVVPEWQGSPSARAMQLIDGAEAIRGDLPSSRTVVVEVPLESGSALDTGVLRASSIQMVRQATSAALEHESRRASSVAGDAASLEPLLAEPLLAEPGLVDPGLVDPGPVGPGLAEPVPIEPVPVAPLPVEPVPVEPVLVVGGDCGVALAPIERASKTHGSDLAVVWFDAHGDLQRPETSPSGAFGGMVLRAVIGDLGGPLQATHPVAPERVVLAGARAFDDEEAAYLDGSAVTALTVARTNASELVAAVAASGATSVYIHVDLDVLDPAAIEGITGPEPFGVDVSDLVEGIRALREHYTLVGASLTGFAPASPDRAGDDLGTILRVIGALAR